MRITSSILSGAAKRGLSPFDGRFADFVRKESAKVKRDEFEMRVRAITYGLPLIHEYTPFDPASYGMRFPVRYTKAREYHRGNKAIFVFRDTAGDSIFERLPSGWRRML